MTKKEFETMQAVMASAKFVCSYRHESDNNDGHDGLYVTCGARTKQTENSMVAGLHMLIPSDIAERKLARELGRQLGIHEKRVRAIAAQKKKIGDLAIKHWVVVEKGTYRNKNTRCY